MSDLLTLFLSSIRTPDSCQMRNGLNETVVGEYKDAMLDGQTFPPVHVIFDEEKGDYILVDGFHRVDAANQAEFKRIDAKVIGAGNEQDAIWFALKANATNSLRRTIHDREKAITACLEHPKSEGMTEEEIAGATGTTRREVFRVRAKIGMVKNPERNRDDVYNEALEVIRADCPKLADSISVGIVELPRDEVVRLAGKEPNERKALLPVMEERRLTLKQAEKVVQYIPSNIDLPMRTFIEFARRNEDHQTFYFEDKTVQVDFTLID